MTSGAENLLSQFDRAGLSDEDLQLIAQAQFPYATLDSPQQVTYRRREDQTPALIGRFEGESLIELTPHSSMTPRERDELIDVLAAASTETREAVHTWTIFTQVRPCGWWRYRDRVQLRQLPPEAPASPFLFGPHPIRLDVVARGSAYRFLQGPRLESTRKEVELLLNLFLSAPLLRQPRHKRVWVQTETDGEFDSRCELLSTGYIAPQTKRVLDGGLPRPSGHPMSVVPADDYYARPGVGIGDELDVPSTIGDQFDAFHGLPTHHRRRFRNAAFWYWEGCRRGDTRSAAYLALITAIEAMQPEKDTTAVDRCPECQKAKTSGPTRLFMEFLERYAPQISKKEREALYKLRGKLTHGKLVLTGDQIHPMVFSPLANVQRQREFSARQTVQRALIAWLLDPDKSPE